MAHTPGPWSLGKRFVCHTQILGPDGSKVAATDCHFHEPDGYTALSEANARLIARAPELLEAIEEIARNARDLLDGGLTHFDRRDFARAVLMMCECALAKRGDV